MSVHVESVGKGPPLVLLHGWAMHSGLWMPLLPRLIERFRVHLIDLPGHGHSASVAPYTLDAITGAVVAAVDSFPQPITVLGWSLGGMVALNWALQAPERVGRMVLTAATPCFVQRADWSPAMAAITLKQFGDELKVSYKATLQRFVTLQVQGSEHARTVLSQLRLHLFARGEPSHEVLDDALRVLAETDLRSRVGAITQPALVIAGGRDTLTPPGAAAWLAAALPHASLQIIPGGAHAPFLSHPDMFAAALVKFTDGD